MFWLSAAVVFVECGLLFPILPGDSLLFSVGLFIHTGDISVNIVTACVILSAAAFAGNVVGYEIGRVIGHSVFRRNGRFLNETNLHRTHDFFEKYGTRALVLGRFVPDRPHVHHGRGGGRRDGPPARSSPGRSSAPCCGRPA